MYSPTTPVTGGAQTGFTAPTYTLTSDVAPDATGKQHAVTALGGTQTGVTTHTASAPFTVTAFRPKTFKVLGTPDPATGVVYRVGKNSWKLITRKGVTPAANQSASLMLISTTFEVPAGADTYDGPNVQAALSLHVGILNQMSAGLGDSLKSGIL